MEQTDCSKILKELIIEGKQPKLGIVGSHEKASVIGVERYNRRWGVGSHEGRVRDTEWGIDGSERVYMNINLNLNILTIYLNNNFISLFINKIVSR